MSTRLQYRLGGVTLYRRFMVARDTSPGAAGYTVVDVELEEVVAHYYAAGHSDAKGAAETERDRREHAAEHQACEHLDGAVPYVKCGWCGEVFGYDTAPGWQERWAQEAGVASGEEG